MIVFFDLKCAISVTIQFRAFLALKYNVPFKIPHFDHGATMDSLENANEILVKLLSLRARNSLSTHPDIFLALQKATLRKTVIFLVGRSGRACGYFAYAGLNKESFSRFRDQGALPNNSWEWDEGRLLIVVDCMWRNISFSECRRQLREAIGRARIFAYQRNGVIKIWAKRSTFFHLIERTPITEILKEDAKNPVPDIPGG